MMIADIMITIFRENAEDDDFDEGISGVSTYDTIINPYKDNNNDNDNDNDNDF